MNTEWKPPHPPVSIGPINAAVNSWFKLQKTPQKQLRKEQFLKMGPHYGKKMLFLYSHCSFPVLK